MDMKLVVVVLPVADADSEEETGRPDPDWPDWSARYMVTDDGAGT